MCVGCLITSTLLLFTPADPSVVINQSEQVSLAAKKQVAIAKVISHLPQTADVALLRDGLTDIEGQLSVAINDEEAETILKAELSALSQKVASDAKGDIMFKALDNIIATEDDAQLPWRNKLNHDKSVKWGWLK